MRVALIDGRPDSERISVLGKLSWNGRKLMRASIIGDITVAIECSKENSATLWEDPITVIIDRYVAYLLGIWNDRSERIYLGAYLQDGAKASNIIVILNPEGKELGRVKLFVQNMPHEIHRTIRVSSDGRIFQMAVDKRGAFVRRYDPLQ